MSGTYKRNNFNPHAVVESNKSNKYCRCFNEVENNVERKTNLDLLNEKRCTSEKTLGHMRLATTRI